MIKFYKDGFAYTGDGVFLNLFGLQIKWYAVLILTGMMLALFFSRREFKRRGGNADDIIDIALISLPIAIIGARLWYVIFEWNQYKNNLWNILNIRNGGLAIQGGILAGFVVGYFVAKHKKIKIFPLIDIIFPTVALAQSIGRWGNFANNEAHGVVTNLPFALIINGQRVHPTFLYESLGDLAIFLFLWLFLRKRYKKDGTLFSMYMILYGILRFFVEGLRTDSLWIGTFRTAQLTSIAMIIIGVIVLIWNRNKNKTEKVY